MMFFLSIFTRIEKSEIDVSYKTINTFFELLNNYLEEQYSNYLERFMPLIDSKCSVEEKHKLWLEKSYTVCQVDYVSNIIIENSKELNAGIFCCS